MEFEWDEAKARTNIVKHGISFPDASRAFLDPFGIELLDEDSRDEERTILLGMADGRILVVIFTERIERIRIISARRAMKHEKEYYYRENGFEGPDD